MSHDLDTTAGVTSFVSARLDAWHRLGQVATDAMTAEEAMRLGHLADWNVRKLDLVAPLQLGDGAGQINLSVPDKMAVVRDNPIVKGQVDVLGVVGKDYSVYQFEQVADLLNNMVDESGAHFETAGAIDGGRKVFLTMRLPRSVLIGGIDPVQPYLAAMTSHDGTTPLSLITTSTRIVCANTMNMAFGEAKNVFKVRHTSGIQHSAAAQAREALGFSYKYLDAFEAEAEMLINTTMTQSTFEQMIFENFGAPKDAAATVVTRVQNKLDTMTRLFADANTQEGVRDTAWAGLNALTEYADHFSLVRTGSAGDDEIARSRKALLDPSFKNEALRMVLAAV